MAITKVTTSGITDDAVNAAKIADGTLTSADIAPGTITTAKLAGSITNAKLANNSITINGSAVALGASTSVGTIDWQSVVVSDGSTVTTMVAGRGYFVNNTSAAGIVKLPASASTGDTIAIKDYAGNFGTNKLTIQRNGHNIQGITNDSLLSTNRASVLMVYIDATKGWLFTNESNVSDLQNKTYIGATGGTVTTSGDHKIHTFTGDGNFVVSSVGNSVGGTDGVSYLVIAGAGGGGTNSPSSSTGGGGGGAGGYREGKTPATPYTASPLVAPAGLTVTAQTYPITIGAGGTGAAPAAASGNNSVFSTITSAGGGRGGSYNQNYPGANGGSGGGGAYAKGPGSGNTPPVSPPQGNNGGAGGQDNPGSRAGGGGGGAGATGNADAPGRGGHGGNGTSSQITGSSANYAGGGGGGGSNCNSQPTGGTGGPGHGGNGGNQGGNNGANGGANTGGGGGGGGGSPPGAVGGSGGSGVVIIRYKYQN